MDIELLKLITQIGMDGVLLLLLYMLWTAFQEQNKFIRDMLLDGEAERLAILQALGAERAAQVIKAEMKVSRDTETHRLN